MGFLKNFLKRVPLRSSFNVRVVAVKSSRKGSVAFRGSSIRVFYLRRLWELV